MTTPNQVAPARPSKADLPEWTFQPQHNGDWFLVHWSVLAQKWEIDGGHEDVAGVAQARYLHSYLFGTHSFHMIQVVDGEPVWHEAPKASRNGVNMESAQICREMLRRG